MTYDPTRPHILIAEDSEFDQLIIRRAFQEAGVEARLGFVADGEELLSELRRLANDPSDVMPSLVLLDLNMPRLDGRRALQAVRNDESIRHLPVVVFSTSDSRRDILDAYRLGANLYVVKPVEFKDLVGLMGEVFGFWFRRAKLPRLD